jgi:hypothetical protein
MPPQLIVFNSSSSLRLLIMMLCWIILEAMVRGTPAHRLANKDLYDVNFLSCLENINDTINQSPVEPELFLEWMLLQYNFVNVGKLSDELYNELFLRARKYTGKIASIRAAFMVAYALYATKQTTVPTEKADESQYVILQLILDLPHDVKLKIFGHSL